MTKGPRDSLLLLLRKLSKKGFYEILVHIGKTENVHYNDVLKYALEKKIVQSRASITIALNGLTDLGLVEREVSQTRPIRTTYKISKKGKSVIKNLKELELVA